MPWPHLHADQLRTHVGPPRPRVAETPEGRRLATACREGWQPARCADAPPPWLRAGQVDPWRRLVAALREQGGALLAEPVGAGKTWIALAVAAALGGRVTVIAPAVLLPQWRAAAATVHRRVHLHSIERCSRGVPPAGPADLVFVDEAHRVRNRHARCTHTIADWVIGRRTALLTATPIVNSLRDLAALLQVVLPDHALALDGIPDLGLLPQWREPPPALRRVVIRSGAHVQDTAIARRRFPDLAEEHVRARRAAHLIRSLSLAAERGTRRLLRSVLADAAASSDAAWRATLRRYEALLAQATLAGGASRALLRRFAGPACDQGVLWSMVLPDAAGTATVLPLADLPRIRKALQAEDADQGWLGVVQQLVADQQPTVLFCRHRATARAVRTALGEGTAWITGVEAGIGSHRLPRDAVLRAFGPSRGAWSARRVTPTVLVATDVAAEGLDLQGASRVVHLDLPWTAMRRDQRDGRLVRPGQRATMVEVIERHPDATLVPLLDLTARVDRKGRLAQRWLTALEVARPMAAPPVALRGPRTGAAPHAGLVAVRAGDRIGAMLVEAGVSGAQVVLPERLPEVLAAVERGGGPMRPIDEAALLAAARDAADTGVAFRGLVWRCHHLARRAARAHDAGALAALDLLVVHATHGGPLGLRRRLERLAAGPDDALRTHGLPLRARSEPVTAWVVATGMLPHDADPLRSGDAALPHRPL